MFSINIEQILLNFVVKNAGLQEILFLKRFANIVKLYSGLEIEIKNFAVGLVQRNQEKEISLAHGKEVSLLKMKGQDLEMISKYGVNLYLNVIALNVKDVAHKESFMLII
jgi:hypothetical protein